MNSRKTWVAVCLLGVSLLVTAACTREEEEKISYFNQGNELLLNGEFADAEKAFLQAIALDDQYKDAYVQLGIVQMRRGALKKAFDSFTRAATIDPADMDVQLRLATFHMLGRNLPEAMNILDRVLARDPQNIEALFLKGSLLAQKKDLSRAKALFTRIIDLDCSQVRAYLALVKTQILLGETSEIVPTLHAGISNNPHSLDLKLALVDRYLSLDKIVDAKGVLLDALQHDPGNPRLQEILGAFYFRIGQMAMAESAYKEAVKLSPGQVRPLMHLARFYDLTGKEDQAAQIYDQALEMAPANVQVLDTVSRFYAHAGKLEQAEHYVLMALDANPSFLPSRILQTELALKKGDFDTALSLAQTLLDQGKELPKIHYLKGMCLLALKQYVPAVVSLEQAVKVWPRFVAARLGLARALFHAGESSQARAQAMVVLQQTPDNLDAILLLGNLADGRGDLDEAARYYQQALTINAGYAPAANNLAYVLMRQERDLDRALDLASMALKEMPEDAQILDTLGLIHLKRGEPRQAAEYLARSVAKDSHNPAFLYHLGIARWQQGNRDEALDLLTRALDTNATFRGHDHAREVVNLLHQQGVVGSREDTPHE